MELTTGFKLTEAGVIPEDWDAVRLRDFGRFRSGNGFPLLFQDKGGELPFYKVGDLNGDGTFLTTTRQHISDEARKKLGAELFPKSSIIFAKIGAAIALERKRILAHPACLDNNMMALICHDNEGVRFLHALLSQTPFFDLASATSVPSLGSKVIGNLWIATPPSPEQRAIAAALGDIDAWIVAAEAEAAKLAAVKAAAVDALLTSTTRLPGFEGKWVRHRFGDRGVFRKGRGIRRSEVHFAGLPAVRYGELYTRFGSHIRSFHSYISAETAQMSARLKYGDICFAASGETAEEIGKCAAVLIETRCYAGGDIIIFSPEHDDSAFLGYYLNTSTIIEQKSRLGQGDAVVHIHADKLADLEIVMPTLSEQRAIAAVLTDIDAALDAARAVVAKAKGVKAAAMDALLSGRIRLPLP